MAMLQKIVGNDRIVDVNSVQFFEESLKPQLDKVSALVQIDDSILSRECDSLINRIPPFLIRVQHEDAREIIEPIMKILKDPNYIKTGAGKKFTEESKKEIDVLIKLFEEFDIILQYDKKQPPEKDTTVKGWLSQER